MPSRVLNQGVLGPFEMVEQRLEIGGSVVHARTLERAALKLDIRGSRNCKAKLKLDPRATVLFNVRKRTSWLVPVRGKPKTLSPEGGAISLFSVQIGQA